jgi:hypothetical protein
MREVPPMPEPALTHDRHGEPLLIGPCFTADQIRSRDAIWAGMLEEAVREERERCAKLAEQQAHIFSRPGKEGYSLLTGVAAAIRGKSEGE